MYIIKRRLTQKPFRTFILLSFLLSNLLSGCSDDPVPAPTDAVEPGSWITYSPIKWAHDGEPYHSYYCIVYSDGASYEMKRDVGAFADEIFSGILDLFNFYDLDNLRYPPGYDKIDVYINRFHEENVACAYWGSIFITIRSPDFNPDYSYDYLFKHELTHVFEFLIEGKVNFISDIWFTEGIAIYGGGGLNGITSIEDLESWIAQNEEDSGQGNPIRIHGWDDFPQGADITGYYYNVFDLTMRYLLDPEGYGKSTQDVLCQFYDIRDGMSFPDAFQKNFGISITDFETEYYDLMRAYLAGENFDDSESSIPE